MDADEVASARAQASRQGMQVEGLSDDQLRTMMQQRLEDFRDKAPLSAAGAASIILDGVRHERFRILVGEDAKFFDKRVREQPDLAYEPAFFAGLGPQRAR
jgi:hypothetical protein